MRNLGPQRVFASGLSPRSIDNQLSSTAFVLHGKRGPIKRSRNIQQLRRRIGPEGDLQAAYREWYARNIWKIMRKRKSGS